MANYFIANYLTTSPHHLDLAVKAKYPRKIRPKKITTLVITKSGFHCILDFA